MPVTRNSRDSSLGSDSRLPKSSAAANGARSGDTCFRSTAMPLVRTRSMIAVSDSSGAGDRISTHSMPGDRTIDKHRNDLARSRKSNSPGFNAGEGRRPRPKTLTRLPAVSDGGGPSRMTAARPEAPRHRLPSRTACTATMHSLDGPKAMPRKKSVEGGVSTRGDSTTVP